MLVQCKFYLSIEIFDRTAAFYCTKLAEDLAVLYRLKEFKTGQKNVLRSCCLIHCDSLETVAKESYLKCS